MLAAYIAGLNYGEQKQFAKRFLPAKPSGINLIWNNGDPSKNGTNRVTKSDFKIIQGKYIYYDLNREQIKELIRLQNKKFEKKTH